jgi:hypothetical protein
LGEFNVAIKFILQSPLLNEEFDKIPDRGRTILLVVQIKGENKAHGDYLI